MSAAFDIVDHTLLLQKLELYGFDHNMLGWTRSYLAGRSQAVCINGCLSKLMSDEHGVPQVSILDPLLYTFFTNELPENVHDHSDLSPVVQDESSWQRGVNTVVQWLAMLMTLTTAVQILIQSGSQKNSLLSIWLCLIF